MGPSQQHPFDRVEGLGLLAIKQGASLPCVWEVQLSRYSSEGKGLKPIRVSGLTRKEALVKMEQTPVFFWVHCVCAKVS